VPERIPGRGFALTFGEKNSAERKRLSYGSPLPLKEGIKVGKRLALHFPTYPYLLNEDSFLSTKLSHCR
jgi:hypothetical protein